MVVGTKSTREKKLQNHEVTILVDGQAVKESKSEKLLGVVINNNMTWKEHLYGDDNNKGLISQLSQRLGLLKKIAKVASK